MTTSILRIDDRDVEYTLSTGKAETVVLINGSGGPLFSWAGISEILAPKVNLLAYNRPGIGRSTGPTQPQTMSQMARDLRTLLTSLQVEGPVILVGHSLGGLVALRYALDFGDTIKGLVLMEPSTVDDIEGQKNLPQDRRNPNSELNHVLSSLPGLRSLAGLPVVPTRIGMGTKSGFLSWFLREQLERRRAHLRKLASSIPGSVLIEYGRSGHFPQLTEPQKVAEDLLQLVQQVSG